MSVSFQRGSEPGVDILDAAAVASDTVPLSDIGRTIGRDANGTGGAVVFVTLAGNTRTRWLDPGERLPVGVRQVRVTGSVDLASVWVLI